MNDGNQSQNEKLERLLRKARLPESSPKLKDQITAEAIRAWSQTSVELSWKIPVIRLIASTAAAVLMIWLANVSSDYSMARWQTSGPSATYQQPSELKVLPEMSYVKHLTSINRGLPTTNGSGLHHYIETIRKLLDEAPQNEVSNPPDPAKGRSRLLPDRFNLSSYS